MEYQYRTQAVSVKEINTYIGQLLESNDVLSGITIRGEISNFKHHPSGHLYFSLKEADSVLKCVMFKSFASRLRFVPEDGMRVNAKGNITVYVTAGQYQLYVQGMEPDGIGALYVAYEQLKTKLAAEGLFDTDRKKPIPQYPTHIGLITSPTGAAIKDLTSILARRYPLARVTLYPALVQGEGAVASLINGMQYFSENKPDVIIIGRGGGSIEDLWCFNDEALARVIAACDVPVISAVGHETDFTICDFVADLRAPTPSAAAELAVPDMREIERNLLGLRVRGEQAVQARLQRARDAVQHYASASVLRDITRLLGPYHQAVDALYDSLHSSMTGRLANEGHRLSVLAEKLNVLSPLAVLSRGYAVASDASGTRLQSVRQVKNGDNVQVKLTDGTIHATVHQIQEETDHESKNI